MSPREESLIARANAIHHARQQASGYLGPSNSHLSPGIALIHSPIHPPGSAYAADLHAGQPAVLPGYQIDVSDPPGSHDHVDRGG